MHCCIVLDWTHLGPWIQLDHSWRRARDRPAGQPPSVKQGHSHLILLSLPLHEITPILVTMRRTTMRKRKKSYNKKEDHKGNKEEEQKEERFDQEWGHSS